MFCDVAGGPSIDFWENLGDVATGKLVRDRGYFGEVFRLILSVARPFISLFASPKSSWRLGNDLG